MTPPLSLCHKGWVASSTAPLDLYPNRGGSGVGPPPPPKKNGGGGAQHTLARDIEEMCLNVPSFYRGGRHPCLLGLHPHAYTRGRGWASYPIAFAEVDDPPLGLHERCGEGGWRPHASARDAVGMGPHSRGGRGDPPLVKRGLHQWRPAFTSFFFFY